MDSFYCLNHQGSPKMYLSSVQSLSRVQLCNPMDCSTPGLPVHHRLLELTQTHVHLVGDAIQPSHPLSSLSRNCQMSPGVGQNNPWLRRPFGSLQKKPQTRAMGHCHVQALISHSKYGSAGFPVALTGLLNAHTPYQHEDSVFIHSYILGLP